MWDSESMNSESMKNKYYGVRKVEWDGLWHALYEVKGVETWDRVSAQKANKILDQLKEKANK